MAKKSDLTLDEKLDEARVADWEQPYAVPSNWVWTRLEIIYKFIDYRGKTPTKIQSGIPLVTAKNVRKGFIDYKIDDYISHEEYLTRQTRGLSQKGDILFTTEAPLGNVALADLDIFSTGQRLITFQKKYISEPIINEFYFYYILSDFFQIDINKNKTGSTVAGIKAEKLKRIGIPLPPLAEQERIVKRIESLFSKLDKAKDLAQSALDSFANRKSAILHQAFTGELTKNWREQNNVSFDSWEEKKIKDICNFRPGYAFDSKKFKNNGVQVIRMGNLFNGILDLGRNPVFIPKEEIDKKIYQKNLMRAGDILLTLTGTKYKRDYGYAVLIGNNTELLLNQRIVALTPTLANTKFVFYTLISNKFRDVFFSSETGGVNQGNVSSKFVENILISFPSLPEQKEIVRILDSLLGKEEKSKELTNVITQIDHMKKAILARAFRGELDTNNPQEESAVELLKEILQQETTVEKPKKIISNLKIDKAILTQFKTAFEEEIYRYIAMNQPVTSENILENIPPLKQLDGLQTVDLLERKGFIYKKQKSFYVK